MRTLIAVAVVLLVACCTRSSNPAPEPVMPETAVPVLPSSPAPAVDPPGIEAAPRNEWVADIRDDAVMLYFGYPNSGAIGLAMTCPPGAGAISISTPSFGQTVMEMRSGDYTAALAARIEIPGPVGEEGEAEVHTREDVGPDNPVLDNFRRTGELGLLRPERIMSAVTAAERAEIETFFAACETSAQR